MEQVKEVATPENLQTTQVYIDFVKTNLEPLAQHIGTSVEWLWNILVMQARVEAIVFLIVCLGMFTTSIILSTIFFKSFKKANFKVGYGDSKTVYVHKKTQKIITSRFDDWDNREQYTEERYNNETDRNGVLAWITGIGAAFILLVSIITSASSLQTIVTGLVNPEFRAIEKIVEFVKPEAKQIVEGESK